MFGDLNWVDKCEVLEEFNKDLYLPSADGDFKFHLRTAPFDYKEIARIDIRIDGSYIYLGYNQMRRGGKNMPFMNIYWPSINLGPERIGYNQMLRGGRNMTFMDWYLLQKYHMNHMILD